MTVFMKWTNERFFYWTSIETQDGFDVSAAFRIMPFELWNVGYDRCRHSAYQMRLYSRLRKVMYVKGRCFSRYVFERLCGVIGSVILQFLANLICLAPILKLCLQTMCANGSLNILGRTPSFLSKWKGCAFVSSRSCSILPSNIGILNSNCLFSKAQIQHEHWLSFAN